MESNEAYCFKCRHKRQIVRGQPVILGNGRKSIAGECSSCGGKVSRMVKNS